MERDKFGKKMREREKERDKVERGRKREESLIGKRKGDGDIKRHREIEERRSRG